MTRGLPSSRRGRLVAGGTAVLLLAAAGGALAVTELDSTTAPQDAVVSVAAIVDGRRPGAGGFELRFGVYRPGLRGQLPAAAAYLGLTQAQIRSDLQSGQTLAQVATAQGKSVQGLVRALVSAAEAKLASAVSARSLSAAREQSIESRLTRRITDMVEGTRPPGGGFHRLGRGFGFGYAGNPGLGGGTAPAGTTTTG